MRLFAYSLVIVILVFFLVRYFTPVAFAQIGIFYAPPYGSYSFSTTCSTNGSSCDNMREQDDKYNSWVKTDNKQASFTFEGFDVPDSALIEKIYANVRIRASAINDIWKLQVSRDGGLNYFNTGCSACSVFIGTSFKYSTITAPFYIFDPNPLTGKDIKSGKFHLRIVNAYPFLTNVDIDKVGFNIQYYINNSTSSKTPLILIPGIAGSELKTTGVVNWSASNGHGGTYAHTYPEEKVWVNTFEALKVGDDDYFDILRLKADGQTSEANIALTGSLYDSYKEAIDFFTSNGYTLNKDFFVFPYDWRKDIGLTAPLLDQKIKLIKQQTQTAKVDIVAHSMGGLVARNYISDANRAQNVRKMFTLGTPHLGSVHFLKALRYGGCLKYEIGPVCFSLASFELKDILQNMTGGYELAPTQKYFSFYTNSDTEHPYPIRDERDMDDNKVTGALNYQQTKTLLSNMGHNTSLFTPSETFHALDNTLSNTNNVEVINIVGSGLPTLGQIVEKYLINFLGVKIPKKDEISVNGDATVPLFSASLIDSDISLLGGAKVYYTKQEHGNLVVSGPALNLVKNILSDNYQLPVGVSNTSYSLNGTKVAVYSPVNIHVYDSLGNHTGLTSDGNFEENIPGSLYDSLDDAKFIWLPDSGQYTIKLEATDDGSFDLRIRKFENNVNTSVIAYNEISLTDSTKAETTIDTLSSSAPILQLDLDGDGSTDKTINASSVFAGDEAYDIVPPQTTIQLTGLKGDSNWYKSDVTVALLAQDETSGSGVAKIEYSLDNGQTIQEYANPFVISTEGTVTLKFRSTDKAGNREALQEIDIQIDISPPEARIFIDQDSQDLVVTGVDSNSTKILQADSLYVITDEAGNSLKIDVRERDKEKQDKFRIFALTYNDASPIFQQKNYYAVSYHGKKGKAYVKEQQFELDGVIKIRIKYDSKKDESTIATREAGSEKIKEVRKGLAQLQLRTNEGSLQIGY